MKRMIQILPLLLFALMASAEPIVRIVSSNGSDKSFATTQVHKLVLLSDDVDVMDNQGSVLLSVSAADIVRVEFAEGKPDTDTPTAVEAILIWNNNEAVKIFEHGHVFILCGGKKYTMMGVEVDNKE